MKITELHNSGSIRPLKYPLHEVPHVTIEPNRTCNLNCEACYNIDRQTIKSLRETKKEIDCALRKRKLETATIVGGEPTMHKQITAIVKYIKSKGLMCQMFTNGVVFLHDKDDGLLNRLIAAGIDRIFLHIEIGRAHV